MAFSLNRRQPEHDTYNNAGRRKDSHHSEMKAEGEAVEDGEIETEVIGDSITISIKLLPLIKSLQAQHGLRWGHDIKVSPALVSLVLAVLCSFVGIVRCESSAL